MHAPVNLLLSSTACREDCEQYVCKLWDWLEGLGTGLKRDDPATWSGNWPPTYRGILNNLEIAHASHVWAVRSHPRLVKAGADEQSIAVAMVAKALHALWGCVPHLVFCSQDSLLSAAHRLMRLMEMQSCSLCCESLSRI